MKMTIKKGFTLVELVIVIVILGVLAAVVIGNFTGLTGKSRSAAAKQDLDAVRSAVQQFITKTGEIPAGDVGTTVKEEEFDTMFATLSAFVPASANGAIANPPHLYVAINFDKLAKQYSYTDFDGASQVITALSSVPKSSYFQNPAAATPSVNSASNGAGQAYVFVLDRNKNVYISQPGLPDNTPAAAAYTGAILAKPTANLVGSATSTTFSRVFEGPYSSISAQKSGTYANMQYEAGYVMAVGK